MSDSDDNDLPYGNHKKVQKVSGEHRQDMLEFKDILKWSVAMVTIVKESDWLIGMTRKFEFCPCSKHC